MNNLSQKRSAWVYAKENPVILLSMIIGGFICACAMFYTCFKLAQKLKVIKFIKENIHIVLECATYVVAVVAGYLLVSFLFKNIVYNIGLYNAMKYLPLTVAELNEHGIATCDQMDTFLKEIMFKSVHRGHHIDTYNIYNDLVDAYKTVLSIEHDYIDKNQDMIESNKRATIICDWLKMN